MTFEPVSSSPVTIRLFNGRRTKLPKDVYDDLKLLKGCDLSIQVVGVKWPGGAAPTTEEKPQESEAPPRTSTPEEDLRHLKEAGVSDDTILTIKEMNRGAKDEPSDEAISTLQGISKGVKNGSV